MASRRIGLLIPRTRLLLIGFVLAAVGLGAAVPEIRMTVGFDDLFRPGETTPVTVTVRNPEAPLSGRLVLDYSAGTSLERGDRSIISRPIDLPSGTTGAYRFILPLDASTYPLVARIEGDGILIARTEAILRPFVARGAIAVGISRRPSLDALLPGLIEAAGRHVELRYPRVETLPEDARAWSGADLALWHDMPADDLDRAMIEALALWVEGGGILVAFDGPALAGRGLPAPLPSFPVPTDMPAGERRIETIPFGAGSVIAVSDGTGVPPASREAGPVAAAIAAAGAFGPRFRPARSPELEQRITEIALRRDGPISGLVGPAALVPAIFAVISAGILWAGRRISTVPGRWMEVLLLTSVAAAATLTIMLRANQRSADPVPVRLELVVADNNRPLRRTERYRYWSPEAAVVQLPLIPGQQAILPDGGDTEILHASGTATLSGMEMDSWTPFDITLESLGTGGEWEFNGRAFTGSANTGTEDRPAWRPAGTRTWKDVVLIQGGTASLLARSWAPGSILTMPENPEPFLEPSPGPFANRYASILQTLTADQSEPDKILLGWSMDSSPSSAPAILLHLGDDE